jgi:1-aminocyclopropane-1-carboxylate deaminase
MNIEIQKPRADTVSILNKIHTTADVLRLDIVHPVISGNKWYKLKEYIKDAVALNKKTVLTYGGAYSNHIVATAAACADNNLKSIGIIRGEKPSALSHTLLTATGFGMKSFFISREDYKAKIVPDEIFEHNNEEDIYIINEGGYGKKGAEGAEEILRTVDVSSYSHIIAAVGTGTTLAGLTTACAQHQTTIGISVLKNNFTLQNEIENLLPDEIRTQFSLIHDYHFGGYAKHTKELIKFMNDWFQRTGIPSDFVYTGKLFFAINDLIEKKYFPDYSKLLIIHSGGLQGNLSMPKGTLIF